MAIFAYLLNTEKELVFLDVFCELITSWEFYVAGNTLITLDRPLHGNPISQVYLPAE